jgi:O-antigen/teichoic acid export membrane protein
MVQRLSYQLNDVLFPAVVDCDATSRTDRLQSIFVQGTRLSLATVIPLAGALALLARPLVDAWVGSEFRGSVIVIQLLLATVVVQIGTATANTLLKGAGGHRVVAAANGATTAASIASSIAVAGQLGLAGIAVATFLPVLILSTLVSFPAACRRVELPVSRAIALAVWPAVWPAAIMILYVTATRQFMGRSLAAVGFEIATAAFVYVATFFFVGITPGDRRLYLAQAGALAERLRLQLASEGA